MPSLCSLSKGQPQEMLICNEASVPTPFSLQRHPICLRGTAMAWRTAALTWGDAFTQTLCSTVVRSTNYASEEKRTYGEGRFKTAFSHLWNTFKTWPPAGWPKRVSTVWDLLTPLSAGNQANLNFHNLLKTDFCQGKGKQCRQLTLLPD